MKDAAAPVIPLERQCDACGQARAVGEFVYGSARCEDCRREAERQRKRKAYEGANRDRIRERSRAWKLANPDKVRRSARARIERDPSLSLFHTAKKRAAAKGVPFAITLADVRVPEFCPVLGLRLVVNRGAARANSPTLDRINPALGYVPGNVAVISHRANTLKNNSTSEELARIVYWMRLHGA